MSFQVICSCLGHCGFFYDWDWGVIGVNQSYLDPFFAPFFFLFLFYFFLLPLLLVVSGSRSG